jgi:dolichol-phosphate mannosyltransferase
MNSTTLPDTKQISISAIVPVHNEQDNIKKLLEEIVSVSELCGISEIIFVDDCSNDETSKRLEKLEHEVALLTVLSHQSQCGQSAAIYTGILHASSDWIVTMDGDGQNNPADISALVNALMASGNDNVKLVNGNRNRKNNRQDSFVKRWSSKVANTVRSAMLQDNIPDSGCGLKLMCRATYLKLPYFNNIHRFTPALFVRTGADLLSVDVSHRPRERGSSHYGIWNRLWIGIVDLLGVSWLMRKGYKAKVRKADQAKR